MDFAIENSKTPCLEHPKIIEQHSDDRLSNLPVDLIYRILSFLDASAVVGTSLLSRKWRHIWTSVPGLNFDLEGFWHHVKRQDLNYDGCLLKFWEFVKWTITIREAPPLHRLHLTSGYIDTEQLKLLLRLCAMRNVQELELVAVVTLEICPFPSAIAESVLAIPQNCNCFFGNLKSLHLVRVQFTDADFTYKLFSDFGVLEDLSLEYCCLSVMKVLKFSSDKLQKLTFVNVDPVDSFLSTSNFVSRLIVNTPNLVSFCYIGPALLSSRFSNMPSLDHARIHIINRDFPKNMEWELHAIVTGFSHVKGLSLSADCVLFFCPIFRAFYRGSIHFGCLRVLNLDIDGNADHMEGLIVLLKASPKLEVLYIKFVNCWWKSVWVSTEMDLPCLSHHLRRIVITDFYDSEFSMEFIKFFLQNGKMLEKIEITQHKQKMNPQKLYALQSVQLASKEVYVSVVSHFPSGKIELLQFVYRKRGVVLWKRFAEKLKKTNRSMRDAALKSGVSFRGNKRKKLFHVLNPFRAPKKIKPFI
ncbi:hypothetical protein ACP275_02G152200 [Erythranthe tilingii]